MANLGIKGDVYLARFRYLGKEYKRSLKTRSQSDAKAALCLVELTLHRLHTGQLAIGEGIDPGDFIVSGGACLPSVSVPPPPPSSDTPVPPPPPVRPSTETLVERFLEIRGDECAPTYLDAQRYHLNRFKKHLGDVARDACDAVTVPVIEQFLRGLKKKLDGESVNRYRSTLTQFYKWMAGQADVAGFALQLDGLPKFSGGRDRDPFRTYEEIEAVLQRGGLDEEEVFEQWEALYLDTTRLAQLLALVRERSQDMTSFMLHAIPAYTGMRRGEVLRLRWTDVDLTHDIVTARSRKQSRNRTEVSRQIDMHPELKKLLQVWQSTRPSGQYVLTAADGKSPLTPDQANRLFWLPMRGTDWCLHDKRNLFKIGFHSFRHSLASNLAAAGVDERVIDSLMGHTTEAMRKRYRHLFPKVRRSAIESLVLPTFENRGIAG